jgi:hypothetical protein
MLELILALRTLLNIVAFAVGVIPQNQQPRATLSNITSIFDSYEVKTVDHTDPSANNVVDPGVRRLRNTSTSFGPLLSRIK